jgi:hypothetical protein
MVERDTHDEGRSPEELLQDQHGIPSPDDPPPTPPLREEPEQVRDAGSPSGHEGEEVDEGE